MAHRRAQRTSMAKVPKLEETARRTMGVSSSHRPTNRRRRSAVSAPAKPGCAQQMSTRAGVTGRAWRWPALMRTEYAVEKRPHAEMREVNQSPVARLRMSRTNDSATSSACREGSALARHAQSGHGTFIWFAIFTSDSTACGGDSVTSQPVCTNKRESVTSTPTHAASTFSRTTVSSVVDSCSRGGSRLVA